MHWLAEANVQLINWTSTSYPRL